MNFRTLNFLLLVLTSCAPYANGPVFKIQGAKDTFAPILEFMDAKPGMQRHSFRIKIVSIIGTERLTLLTKSSSHTYE